MITADSEENDGSNAPYALASAEEQDRRKGLLTGPHMAPLMNYLHQVRNAMGDEYDMPAFDPCDGGINARVLFLLEAPGPKAVGSKFISRNNPDPTARNMCKLLEDAHILRHDTLIWNIVPWYVGDGRGRIRPVKRSEILSALPHLQTLLGLLPNLAITVLVGRKAESASLEIKSLTDIPLMTSPHPSAQVFNRSRAKKQEAEAVFAEVAFRLGVRPEPDGSSANESPPFIRAT